MSFRIPRDWFSHVEQSKSRATDEDGLSTARGIWLGLKISAICWVLIIGTTLAIIRWYE